MAEAATVHLEVEADTEDGDEIAVAGAEPSLGKWDTAAAIRFARGEAPNAWSCQVPLPTGGEEFKFILIRGGDVQWEPLADNRRWPTTGLGPGARVRMRFGEARMAIEASAEHLAANARRTRKLEDRSGSALQMDLDQKGDNAYYYAHSRHFEVPEDAKVITGPGIITGGAPVLIEAGAEKLDATAEERTVWLKDYSWSDCGAKVKVYVPVSEGVLPTEGADSVVEAAYDSHRVELTIKSMPRRKLTIDKLNAEIKAESCTTRVEAHKGRIVLQLAKKRENAWYNLTKSK